MKRTEKQQQRFRTGEQGFTLIELIVVIAIIGILAAIGAVAYSGYIELANQAADEQLISDVSYAIQLGAADEGISGEEDYGYVRMEADGMEVCMGEPSQSEDTGDEDADLPDLELLPGLSYDSAGVTSSAVLLAADFDSLDEDAKKSMAEGWLEDGLGSGWRDLGFQSDYYRSATAVIVLIPSGEWYVYEQSWSFSFSQTIAENLEIYAASSYVGYESDLMTSVEGVATTFGGMLENLYSSGNTVEEGLAALLGYYDLDEGWLDEEGWTEILADFGIDEDSEMTADQAGNLMVMYMASLLTDDYTDDGIINEDAVSELVDSIASSDSFESGSLYDESTYENLTAYFGGATAYYLSGEGSETFNSYYETALEQLTSGTDNASAASGYLINLCTLYVQDIDEDSDYYISGDMYDDTAAFMSLMSVLTESNDSGEFDFDLSDMSWNDGSSTDVLSFLEAMLDYYEEYQS